MHVELRVRVEHRLLKRKVPIRTNRHEDLRGRGVEIRDADLLPAIAGVAKAARATAVGRVIGARVPVRPEVERAFQGVRPGQPRPHAQTLASIVRRAHCCLAPSGSR